MLYRALAEGSASIEEVEEQDRIVAAKILSENQLAPEAMEFYGTDVELLVVSLSSQLYIHALLERSKSLLAQRCVGPPDLDNRKGGDENGPNSGVLMRK